ncbi:hypothetical protein ACFS4T_14730 [Pseudomonas lini]
MGYNGHHSRGEIDHANSQSTAPAVFLLILTLIGVDKLHGARPVLVGPAPQALLPRE